MVKTRSGAGGITPPSKGKTPYKIISKKETPKKRLLTLTDINDVILDFSEPLPPPKICVLPKFTSALLSSGQPSPSFTSLNNAVEAPRQCWTPLPEEQRKMSISIPKIDAILTSLQKNVPSNPAWVRRYELFVQDAPIEATEDDILRKWLGKVFSSGMPWMGALSQLPMSLRNQARKIMISHHAGLYL
jgi:hypothetical protein